MFIRTQRLFLRPAWREDWPVILAGVGDPAVARNLLRLPWPYGEAEARAFASQPQQPWHPHFLVTRPLDAVGVQVLGCAGLAPGEDGDAELGFWIARPHWGQGYATEAARGVLSIARMLGHRRVSAAHFVDNPASARVLARQGFAGSGELIERFCPARGMAVATRRLTLDLGAEDGDGGDDGGDMRGGQAAEAMRQAA